MTDRVLTKLLLVLGMATLLSSLALWTVQLNAFDQPNAATGAWMSLAYYTSQGMLYPPIAKEGHYGGTRHMPLFFSLHAGLARLTGEYYASGRLAVLLSLTGLIVAMALAIRSNTLSVPLAVAVSGLVLATGVGMRVLLAIRGDVLPVFLSVLGLLVIERCRSRRMFVLGAALLALAPLAKFTAFSALIAATVYLLLRAPRRAAALLLVALCVLGTGLLATQWLSGGRFVENLISCSAGGTGGRSLPGALYEYGFFLYVHAQLLVPLAFLGFLCPHRASKLWQIYFVTNFVLALGFFFDVGSASNHLIELLSAATIAASVCLRPEEPSLRRAALLVFAWLALLGLGLYHVEAWRPEHRQTTPRQLVVRELELQNKHFLSEDPTLSILMNKKPVVLDFFMFRVLTEKGIIPPVELPQRIRNKEFDRVILLRYLPSADALSWYREKGFGDRVARAILDAYVFEKEVRGYYVYRPK